MAEKNLNSSFNQNDECDEEGTVTMVDVLKAEEILEENADAVLGPGDDKNCTYNEGYLKRQALYSCLTCLPSGGAERAGVCLACSYHCHTDHDLVELYTKRNFRCDCGNNLFKGQSCTLDPLKSGTNENNCYNQNFRGVYCFCSRPYPDPEDSVEDEMIQCVVCEDWFHTRHLDSNVPKEDDYAEMICGPCTDKLPFLQYYLGYSVSKISKADDKNESSANISVTEVDNSLNSTHEQTECSSSTNEIPKKDQSEHISVSQDTEENMNTSGVKESTAPNSINHDVNESPPTCENKITKTIMEHLPKTSMNSAEHNIENATITSPTKDADSNHVTGKETECLLKTLKMLPRGSGATFWPDGFRKQLCTCDSCLELYKSSGVPFLTDEEDTVRAYEDKGKTRKVTAGPTQYERGMEALSSLDRVQQMEAILSYNEMKTHLSEYLAKFVENKKVVREEDIREFFSGMQARKRQKLDIPYNCR